MPRIIGRDERVTPRSGAEDSVAAIEGATRAPPAAVNASLGEIAAVACSAPGPLDHRGGIVHEAPNVVGFIDYPLGPRLAEELGVAAIYLDRDTIMAAVGEAVAGAARGARNFIYVTISTGIGGAIVIDGRLLRGGANTAGEIGHFPVALEGARCGCGGYGRVESLAAGRFVAEADRVDGPGRLSAAGAGGDGAAGAGMNGSVEGGLVFTRRLGEAKSMTKIAINGFGRIGRQFLKALIERHPEIEIVALNDLADPQMNALLFRHDSNYGKYPGEVSATADALVIDGRRIRVLQEKEPAKLPWKDLGVDIVIESTGFFTDATKARAHLDAGAKYVIISAPAKNEDKTVVLGVNEKEFDPEKHHIISNASCT